MTTATVAAALASAVGGRAEPSFGEWCVHVAAGEWLSALRTARDDLSLTYLDWLGGVDEAGADPGPDGAGGGFAVLVHLLDPTRRVHLLLRTELSAAEPRVDSAVSVFAGAGWHERETAEMYGIVFVGHPDPSPLLLPVGFVGHPLRKDYALVARESRPWPGSVDPTGKERRRALPPGVPDPAGRSRR